ncbi:protein of unknown function (plasmid) [Enterobacter cancerogenus]|uniref:hypothetical protein n=1 Tax=Enterobacter cancerogenus TaxID=69218 RepID=UPI001AF2D91C|nr:protein of unknown function [Enterobacter cancerogenus]
MTLLIIVGSNWLDKRRALFNWRNPSWCDLYFNINKLVRLTTSVLHAIVAAFSLGRIRVTRKAKAKADQQRTEEISANSEAVTKRRIEATKEISTTQ